MNDRTSRATHRVAKCLSLMPVIPAKAETTTRKRLQTSPGGLKRHGKFCTFFIIDGIMFWLR